MYKKRDFKIKIPVDINGDPNCDYIIAYINKIYKNKQFTLNLEK